MVEELILLNKELLQAHWEQEPTVSTRTMLTHCARWTENRASSLNDIDMSCRDQRSTSYAAAPACISVQVFSVN